MRKIQYTQEDIIDHHAVGAIIKNNKGEILVQEHVKYGFWTIPAGKVSSGQSIQEGLKKEILEECNVVLEEFKEIQSKEYVYKRIEKMVLVTGHLFEVLRYSGILKNNEPEKHTQQIFIDLEKIKKLPYLSDLTLLYLETLGFKRDAVLY